MPNYKLVLLPLKICAIGGFAAALSACSGGTESSAQNGGDAPRPIGQPADILNAAIANPARSENAARDIYRHPKSTLEFFGLAPNQTVVEIHPGGGWYSDILAPYAKASGGHFVGAIYPESRNEFFANANRDFIEKFVTPSSPDQVSYVQFGNRAGLGESGRADMVLSFRSVHNWMRGGWAEKAFDDFYDVLKPGGTLGIVEHRLPATEEQDPRALSGYVQEAYVKKLASDAGFEFVGSSEVNANPKDTADHPVGVWTLPPSNRRVNDNNVLLVEDGSKYEAIGESDRMTLKFRKP